MQAPRLALPRLVTVLGVALVVAACGGAGEDGADEPTTPASSTEESTAPTASASSPGGSGTGGTDEVGGPVDDLPDEVVDAVLAAAGEQTGVPVDEIGLLRAQAVQWSDGSLGCPEPGVEYTQAIVDGYWVVVAAGDAVLDYRTGSTGVPQLCEGGGEPPISSTS